jgi:ABC-type multidrug transport system fused ATPase/permease subunit
MTKNMRELLAGYVDNELTQEERETFERELKQNPELRAELEEFRRLKEVTGMVRYADLPDEVWESYWQSIYRKLERGIGWILFSVGAIILLIAAAYAFFAGFLADPTVPLIIKVGVSAIVAGLIFLLVSYIRERLFAYHRDRYKEVQK